MQKLSKPIFGLIPRYFISRYKQIVGPAALFKQDDLLNQCSHECLMEENFVQKMTELHKSQPYISAYAGFDPTGDKLHFGHLITIIAMLKISLLNIKPIFLIGGATAQIGDPSFKSKERVLLEEKIVEKNSQILSESLQRIVKNIQHYIQQKNLIEQTSQQQVEIINNKQFYQSMNVLNFLRDIGKYFRVNNMLVKEGIASRLNNNSTGISFAEFSYPLLQAYDFEQLYLQKNCILQVGGSDQWGNIISGYDLIKKKYNQELFCITLPLMLSSKGIKLGKTEGNGIWIDYTPNQLNQLYQYIYNIPDEMVIKLIKMLTFTSSQKIEELRQTVIQTPEKRIAQKYLASEIIKMLSSSEGLQCENNKIINQNMAQEKINLLDSEKLKQIPLQELEELTKLIQTRYVIDDDFLSECNDTFSLLMKLKYVKSKNEARKIIQNGGFHLNNQKIYVEDTKDVPVKQLLEQKALCGKYIIAKLGKKNMFLIEIKKENCQ